MADPPIPPHLTTLNHPVPAWIGTTWKDEHIEKAQEESGLEDMETYNMAFNRCIGRTCIRNFDSRFDVAFHVIRIH